MTFKFNNTAKSMVWDGHRSYIEYVLIIVLLQIIVCVVQILDVSLCNVQILYNYVVVDALSRTTK
jgi:hypothetical protein